MCKYHGKPNTIYVARKIPMTLYISYICKYEKRIWCLVTPKCLQVKNKKLLKETTDNKTYKCAHKRIYGRCWICPYHGTFWSNCSDIRWNHYYYYNDETLGPDARRFHNPPNWKLVSKNKKQWMRKKFIFNEHWDSNRVYFEIGWE